MPYIKSYLEIMIDFKTSCLYLFNLRLVLQGCIFKRFYPGQFNPHWDVEDTIAGGSCWQRAFATEDEFLVESICKGNGVSFDWIPVDSSKETPPTLVTQECFKNLL